MGQPPNSSAIWAIGAFGIGGWVRASRWWVPARQFVYGRSALGRPEVLAAAALQGAIFAVVKAAVDRGGAVGVQKLTGEWPG